jgi:SAM-dependent methyltransferase
MWQIPLIGMTLTGGLWFGVAKTDATPGFQICLLGLAADGNVGLLVILTRLRYIMERYLDWLRAFDTAMFVEAPGAGPLSRPLMVRTVFQVMLGLAAMASILLMTAPAKQMGWWGKGASSDASIIFYDRQAEDLADAYEAISFETAHPELVGRLQGKARLRILDIGAGTGRDAAWMASAGHSVTAVEPADKMMQLAQALHPSEVILWVKDSLPELTVVGPDAQFDLIVLSAVWMHVHPKDRAAALSRLADLRAPGGEIYMTLRTGPSKPERPTYDMSVEQLRTLASHEGLAVHDLGERIDLLGRSDVSWRVVTLSEQP